MVLKTQKKKRKLKLFTKAKRTKNGIEKSSQKKSFWDKSEALSTYKNEL